MASRAVQLARTPRARRVALWTGAAVVVLAILGYLVAPPIVRRQLEQVLTEKLHRQVTIEQIRINPIALSVSVIGFGVKERGGDATAVSFAELYLNLSSASLFRLAPVVEALRLTQPYIRVVRNEDKAYSFQDLLEPPREQPASGRSALQFALYNVEVIDGRIDFDDQPERKQHSITDLHIGIPLVSNLSSHVDIKVHPQLSAKVNGTPVGIIGETRPFTDTRETMLQLDLDDLPIARYFEYSPVPLAFTVASGRLNTRLVVSFATMREGLSRLVVSGSASVRELTIQQRDASPLVVVDQLTAELDSLDIVRRSVAVKSVRIEAPRINIARRHNGEINLLRAFASAPSPAPADASGNIPADPPFAFRVAEVALVDGTVRLIDEFPTKPYRVELQNISLTLGKLSNARDAKADVRLRFDTDAKGTLAYDGTVQLTPLRVGGKVDVARFRLDALQPYIADMLNLQVAQGSLAMTARFDVGAESGKVDGRLDDVACTVSALRLAYPGDNEPLWQIPVIELKDTAIDIGKRLVRIGTLSVQTPTGQVRRDPDGTTNYARLLKRRDIPQSSDGTPPPAAWRVEAKRLALDHGAFVFEDRVPPTPVATRLTRLSLEAVDFSSAAGARTQTTLRTIVNGQGAVSVTGPLSQIPVAGILQVDVRGLELAPFQPYLDQHVSATLAGGSVSAKGTVALDLTGGAPQRVAYRGAVSILDFASLDRATSQDLLKWKSLAVGGIDFELEPLKVAVDDVTLADFYSRLIVNADGTLNLQALIRKPGSQQASAANASGANAEATASRPQEAVKVDPPSPSAQPASRGPPPNVRIGGIALQGGNINFSDFFVKPNYSANLTNVGGKVTEMTPDQPGNVELRGQIDQTAALEILGQLNTLSPDLFVDLKASAKDIELPPLSPYAVKYAGYGIERGKLSVSVKYLVQDRKVVAENNVYLDQLTFGEKVESTTATNLPVLLAVALLKDRNGVIDINVPISGSLDDPQFSLGGVIIRAITNLIVKAVTSPFALLGSLFGGGEELAYVEFTPGSARLDTADETKLATLAKALADRPGLKLDVSGRVDHDVDLEGLKRAALGRQVKAAKRQEMARSGAAVASLDDVNVEASEYAKYLTLAYRDAKFAKPRNVIGLPKDLSVPEMEQLLLANMSITAEDLRQLANARARSTKDWLVAHGKIAPDRVFVVAPRLSAAGIKDTGKVTRVDFTLK